MPSAPVLLDEVQQDDRVGHDDADQHQEPDQGADADGSLGQEEGREGADRRQRQAEHDDERVDQRVEDQHHHDVDEQDRDGHRDEEAAEGLGHLLGDAAELGGYAGKLAVGLRACRSPSGSRSRLRRCPCSSESAEIVAAGD